MTLGNLSAERSEFKEGMLDKKRLYLAKTLEYVGNKQYFAYYVSEWRVRVFATSHRQENLLDLYQKALAQPALLTAGCMLHRHIV